VPALSPGIPFFLQNHDLRPTVRVLLRGNIFVFVVCDFFLSKQRVAFFAKDPRPRLSNLL
jgi:hypothetical protein